MDERAADVGAAAAAPQPPRTRLERRAKVVPPAGQGPAVGHWFGTDRTVRDTFALTLYAGRVSLAIGFVAAAISIAIGGVLGAVLGYFCGRAGGPIMGFTH